MALGRDFGSTSALTREAMWRVWRGNMALERSMPTHAPKTAKPRRTKKQSDRQDRTTVLGWTRYGFSPLDSQRVAVTARQRESHPWGHYLGLERKCKANETDLHDAAVNAQQFSLWPLPPEGGTTNGRRLGEKRFVVPASAGPKAWFRAILRIAGQRHRMGSKPRPPARGLV